MAKRVTLIAKATREVLVATASRPRLAIRPTKGGKMSDRERISMREIADITGLHIATIEMWRNDIRGFWKGLAPCPANPPITSAYSECERIEFYMDDLLEWLRVRSTQHHDLVKWFQKCLARSKTPEHARRVARADTMRRQAIESAMRDRRYYQSQNDPTTFH